MVNRPFCRMVGPEWSTILQKGQNGPPGSDCVHQNGSADDPVCCDLCVFISNLVQYLVLEEHPGGESTILQNGRPFCRLVPLCIMTSY